MKGVRGDLTDELSCLRCQGCGAPVYAGDVKCRYCGRVHDWESIMQHPSKKYEVLRVDEIPVEIVKKPPHIPPKITR